MPQATRVGDKDQNHCSTPRRAEGAKTVFVNGKAWSCVGHKNDPHLRPAGDKCTTHTAAIASGSKTVFVEGRSAGRVGDPVAACTFVATGSENVFCGG